MSGAKLNSSQQAAFDKVVKTVLRIQDDSPPLSNEGANIITTYTLLLPLLRMMAYIIPVPNPEYLFELYTEKQAKLLITIVTDAFINIFTGVDFIETPLIRNAYRAQLTFSSLSQKEYEDYLMRKSLKGEMAGGGSPNYFEKLFSKQSGGGGLGSPNRAAGAPGAGTPGSAATGALVPAAGASGATGALTAQTAAAITAAPGAMIRQAEQQAAQTVEAAAAQKIRERAEVAARILTTDIKRLIAEKINNPEQLSTFIRGFLDEVKQQFLENTEINVGEMGKVSMGNLQRYATSNKQMRLTKFKNTLPGANPTEPSKPDWVLTNWGGVLAGAAAVGGAWAFSRKATNPEVPIRPKMAEEYTVMTADDKPITQKPGQVYRVKTSQGRFERKGRLPRPFGFYNGTVTTYNTGDDLYENKGWVSTNVSSDAPETVQEERLKKHAKPYIEDANKKIDSLQEEKVKIDKTAAERLGTLEQKMKGYRWMRMTYAPQPLTAEEQTEYDTLKAKFKPIDDEIEAERQKIRDMESLVPPEQVTVPSRKVNGTVVLGRISYNLDELEPINRCWIGTNYSDVNGEWGCYPVPRRGLVEVWDPVHGKYIPSPEFPDPSDPSKQLDCRDLSTSYSGWDVFKSGALGLGTYQLARKVGRTSETFAATAGGLVSLFSYLGMSQNAGSCAAWGVNALVNAAGSASILAVGAVGAGSAGYFLYKQYDEYRNRQEIEKLKGDVNKKINEMIGKSIEKKLRDKFLIKFDNFLSTVDERFLSTTIQQSLTKATIDAVKANTSNSMKVETQISILKDVIPKLIETYLNQVTRDISNLFSAQLPLYYSDFTSYFTDSKKIVKSILINLVLNDVTPETTRMIKQLIRFQIPTGEKIQISAFKRMDSLIEVLSTWESMATYTAQGAAAATGAHAAAEGIMGLSTGVDWNAFRLMNPMSRAQYALGPQYPARGPAAAIERLENNGQPALGAAAAAAQRRPLLTNGAAANANAARAAQQAAAQQAAAAPALPARAPNPFNNEGGGRRRRHHTRRNKRKTLRRRQTNRRRR
jgi:hypothetical protein